MDEMQFHNLTPGTVGLRREVLEGLRSRSKRLPPKLFYDERGSELFEEICRTPEYYPTRTELSLLRHHAGEILNSLGDISTLFEFGSGTSVKTRLLLGHEHSPISEYVPIDISLDLLRRTSAALAIEFPSIRISSFCADYSQNDFGGYVRGCFSHMGGPASAFFPGSTLGNFEPAEAVVFLREAARLLSGGGCLIVGVDLIKDRRALEAAYNDSAGVTAEFNLNILRRLNRELGACFDLELFRHAAFFNERESRIEMHLVSAKEQIVRLSGTRIHFRRHESIHTENSYKYTRESMEALAAAAGFEIERFWTDTDHRFGIFLLRVKPFQAEPLAEVA